MRNSEREARRAGPVLSLAFAAAGLMALCSIRVCVAAEPAADSNWPQWRGPLATGASPAADPPTTWSETSNVRWKVQIPGTGSATPLIWGNQVFVQTAIPVGPKPQADAADRADNPRSSIRLIQNAPGR